MPPLQTSQRARQHQHSLSSGYLPSPVSSISSLAPSLTSDTTNVCPASPPSTDHPASDIEKLASAVKSLSLDSRTLPPAPPSTPTCFDSGDKLAYAKPFAPPIQAGSTETNSSTGVSSPVSEVSTGRSRRGSRTRPAPLNGRNLFRTKPCKFFMTNGDCVKGNKCNFIHDRSVLATIPSSPTTTVMPSDTSEIQAPRKTRSVSPKESNAKRTEHNGKREFYPITWRVIGGGVKMSGEREVCRDFIMGRCLEGDDCKYAHPGQYEDIPSQLPLFSPTTILPPTPLLFYSDSLSPISPLYIATPSTGNSFHIPSPMAVPPLVQSRQPYPTIPVLREVKSHRPALSLAVSEEFLAPHRVYDGNTLQELPSNVPLNTHGNPDDSHSSQHPGLFYGRAIVRPMSTPPTPSSETKVVKLFAAEMP
ncbi:hypothetical protein C8Q75DRAFT_286865 [Abortiporus biennis]|nr:hypothetical protein C8Q75DRAFT_286865 [Abortiporus biennis]